MNIFRFVGDMTHLGSFVVLLLKILATRSCRGEEKEEKRKNALASVCSIGKRSARGVRSRRARRCGGARRGAATGCPTVPPLGRAREGKALRGRRRGRHPHAPSPSARTRALGRALVDPPPPPPLPVRFPPPFSPSGISLKTQVLYTLVFATRYLDLATRWVSLYNTAMKCVFLGASAAILWLMTRGRGVKATYDAAHDTFRIAFLIVPCAALAALVHADAAPLELAWTFSIYLEAVAILPQLVLLQRTGNVDNLTGDYVFLLGVYRGLYLVNWVWRAWTEPGYRQWIGERW